MRAHASRPVAVAALAAAARRVGCSKDIPTQETCPRRARPATTRTPAPGA